MNEWNAVELVQEIRSIEDRMEKGAKIVSDAYESYLTAKREYTLAVSAHRQKDEGSYSDRSDRATVACHEFWLAMDTADVAYKYAKDLAGVLEKKLSGLQTEAKMLMQAYNVAGIGG